jgi:C-terminal processing protease CtpA/Prc
MRRISLIFSFIYSLAFIVPHHINATIDQQQSIQNSMIQDLEVAKYNISVKYAPSDWKNESYGWDLESVFERGKNRILSENPKTSNEYQKIFSQFMASVRDYHVHPIYFSTSWSVFPIKIKGVNGRYFFTGLDIDLPLGEDELTLFSIDQSVLDMMIDNFKNVLIGDEIIAIDGQPVKELIEQLIDENFNGDRSPTGYAIAERNLFLRWGKFGHHVPSGNFKLTLQHESEKKPYTLTLPWIHIPEWIANQIQNIESNREASIINSDTLGLRELSQNPIAAINELLAKDFSVGLAKEMAPKSLAKMVSELKASLHGAKEPVEIEDARKKSFLPNLGKIIWESHFENEIYAYLYQHPSGKRVGYFYLSSFNASGGSADLLMDEILNAMKIFNNRADALIIDITDNTGGNMMFMYAVLSVLTDRPLKVPSHKELLIQEDVYRAAILYNSLKSYEMENNQPTEQQETLSGYPITKKVIKQIIGYASTIMQNWEAGKRLTEPLYLFGIDEIVPHPTVQFKKPIVVLTNEYNFSCADFFPAILQDNKRAKIFGKKTAGAGGYVKLYPLTSRFGVKGVTLTASIAYRLDGQPIENLGVTPDLPYDLTIRDVRHDYIDYVRQINLEVKKLIK